VEADPSEGGFVWVEATAKTPTGEAGLGYWLGDVETANSEQSAYRLLGPAWLRETSQVAFFGGDTAWEECAGTEQRARKFWKLEPTTE
jgi:hypothetical protein